MKRKKLKRQDIDLTLRCPSGHKLPHHGPKGQCHSMRCNDPRPEVAPPLSSKEKRQVLKKRKREISLSNEYKQALKEDKVTKQLSKREAVRADPQLPDGASKDLVVDGKVEGLMQASGAYGRHQARLAFVKDLPSDDADEVTINNWADKRGVQLLPLAIAEKEFMLKFGNDEQRERAADKVLAMNGRLNREGTVSGGAAIILHIGGEGGLQLPYAPKRLVEGEVKVEPVPAKDLKRA